MAFLKGNTYIDGDLIVDGDIEVGSLSANGVSFTQIEKGEDGKIALTNSRGNLQPSSISETGDGTTTTYTLARISEISVAGNPLTVFSSKVTINTPVNEITASKPGTLYWVYKDGSSRAATNADDGRKTGTSNPYEYPVGVKFV